MRILGIDPGLAIMGYGVVDTYNHQTTLVDYGTVNTPAHTGLPERFSILYDGISAIVQKYKPDMIAFEELFFCKNVTTAISVGQARGVAVIAARKSFPGPIYEYTPKQVKLAVCGYGHADKAQMQQMVRILLNLDHIPKPDDAADALGIAICHAHSYNEFDRQSIM